MITNLNSFGLISAERAELSVEQNGERTKQLRKLLTDFGFSFKEVIGCYNERAEDSFVVNFEHVGADTQILNAIARQFEQDCWLLVASDRTAYLIGQDGRESYAGRFQAVSRDTAHAQDGWTLDLSTNVYYTLVDCNCKL